MECIAVYEIRGIVGSLPTKLSNNKIIKEFRGIKVNLNKQRYVTFANKGMTCECCGLQGDFFALERQDGEENGVLNLYGVNNLDEEIVISVTTNKRMGKIAVGTVLCSECQHKHVSHSKTKY